MRGQSLTFPTLTPCCAQVGRMSTFHPKERGSSQASSIFCALNSTRSRLEHSPLPWAPPASPDNAPAHPPGHSHLSKVTWAVLYNTFQGFSNFFHRVPCTLRCLEGQTYGFGEWKNTFLNILLHIFQNIFLNIFPMASLRGPRALPFHSQPQNHPTAALPQPLTPSFFSPLKCPVLNPGPDSFRGLFSGVCS